MPTHFPLAVDKARYQGDGVAVVIAETRAHANDAAELVEVDYEPLDAVVDVEAALRGRRAARARGARHERVLRLEARDGRDRATFAEADVIVKQRYGQPPLIPNAIEPRGVIVQPGRSPAARSRCGRRRRSRTSCGCSRGATGMPETKLRVIAPDVGGGFGSKLDVYAEEVLCLALARRLGAPVKWIEERSEGYVATIHGRDFVQELELAATRDGKITAIRVAVTAAMGAYLQLVTPGHSAARRLDLRRPVRDPELQLRVHRRLHEHDADRRLPRRRPARGDVRDRADDGRARPRARDRPARAAAQELHHASSRPRSPPG